MANFSIQNSVIILRERMPNGNDELGSKREYFAANGGSLTWAAKVNMAIRDAVPSKYRKQVASALVGRSLDSTKELTVAEAAAIWNSRNNPQFKQFARKVVTNDR